MTLHTFCSLVLFMFFSFTQAHAALEESNLLPLIKKVNELQSKAQALSPELKIIHGKRSQLQAESYSRFSTFLPQANFTMKKSRDFYDERNAPLRALGLQTFDSSWGIDYNWNLFNYGLVQAVRKTSEEKDKTQIEVSNKERSYPITFRTNLLNFLLAKYKKAAVENSLKKAEAGKREAKIGFELGQKTKIDVLRSEANMVSLDSKKTSYSDEEQNTRSKFIEYSGLDHSDLDFLENLDETSILSLINSLSQVEGTSEVLNSKPIFSKSPVLKSLEHEENINKISLNSLTQTQWPDLRIQGSYNNSANAFDQAFHKPYRTHTVALVLTIPLFSGGSLISSHFEEYFAKKQNEYLFEQKKLETQNQLKNTLIKISALETLVKSLALNVSQFEELYRLTLKSYQLGRSSLLELLEVQDNLLDSKISLAQNKIQFYTLSQNYLWQAGF